MELRRVTPIRFTEDRSMPRSRISSCLVVALALTINGCGGGDSEREEAGQKPVEGTFVGKVKGADALVAIVAAPRSGKAGKRELSVYVNDGKRLSEWFPSSTAGN